MRISLHQTARIKYINRLILVGYQTLYTYFYENVPADELSQIYKKLLQNKDILTNLEINIDGNLLRNNLT
jgi:hypothetical protein